MEADQTWVIRGPIATADGGNKVFTIGKLTVKHDVKTDIPNGEASGLTVDTMVVVKGTIVVNETNAKVLQAREIMFHKLTNKFIEGKITANKTAENGKSKDITVDGQVFELTQRAQISNKHKDKGKQVFGFLDVGDFVAIGYDVSGEKNIVTKLKRVDSKPENVTKYKATLNDLTIANDNSTITYNKVAYTYKPSSSKIWNQNGNAIAITTLKSIRTQYGTWNVLLTVKKAAGDSGHAVQVLEIKAPRSAKLSTFVVKLTQNNSTVENSYTFNLGKAQVVVSQSSNVFQGGAAQIISGKTANRITTKPDDNHIIKKINKARKTNDILVKISGSTQSGNLVPRTLTIYASPADFKKSMPHSLD